MLSRLYLGSEIGQGYPGDEDNGEMSAWYVFSALGFYPLVMGSPEYAIGSPLFTKATVHLENGRDLVVKAPDNSAKNVYVQGLKVNGKTWNSTALPHSLLAAGRHAGVRRWARSRPRGAPGRTPARPPSPRTTRCPTPRARSDRAERRHGAAADNTSGTDADLRVGGPAG